MSAGPAGSIGFGATKLCQGALTGHVDGIGIYSRHILDGLRQALGPQRVRPIVFGGNGTDWPEPHVHVRPSYPIAAAWSTLCGSSYPFHRRWSRDLALFHAPDHHVPRLSSVPVIATVMDMIPLRYPHWVSTRRHRRLMNWAFGEQVRQASHVVTISRFSAADIADGLRISPERITAIPLGVEDSFFQPVDSAAVAAALARWKLAAGFFVFVGTLQPRKNLQRVLDAHARLPDRLRREHPVVVIGREGWGTEELVRRLHSAEADGHVRWLRYVPQADLKPLMSQAVAMVYPSLHEGFGLPVLEGFATGLPVITSNTTSIPEVAGDAALLVDPQSVEEIAAAMQAVLQDTVLRDRLVAKGRARAQGFPWSATVAATIDVYRRFAPI